MSIASTEQRSIHGAQQAGQMKHLRVVRLSDQAYTVDALAVRGDEGRANLRKASVR
jgi:hypothetical protein